MFFIYSKDYCQFQRISAHLCVDILRYETTAISNSSELNAIVSAPYFSQSIVKLALFLSHNNTSLESTMTHTPSLVYIAVSGTFDIRHAPAVLGLGYPITSGISHKTTSNSAFIDILHSSWAITNKNAFNDSFRFQFSLDIPAGGDEGRLDVGYPRNVDVFGDTIGPGSWPERYPQSRPVYHIVRMFRPIFCNTDLLLETASSIGGTIDIASPCLGLPDFYIK